MVQRIGELLDQLNPARLDPKEQVVDHERDSVRVSLQHDTEPGLQIDVVICDGWVNFYGVMGHDEAYSDGDEPEDAWESEAIEILSDLLQAKFTIDTYALREQFWREVVTMDRPYTKTFATGSLVSLLPLQRWARQTASRQVTFECTGSPPYRPSRG